MASKKCLLCGGDGSWSSPHLGECKNDHKGGVMISTVGLRRELEEKIRKSTKAARARFQRQKERPA